MHVKACAMGKNAWRLLIPGLFPKITVTKNKKTSTSFQPCQAENLLSNTEKQRKIDLISSNLAVPVAANFTDKSVRQYFLHLKLGL
jgi:hypothetical protein